MLLIHVQQGNNHSFKIGSQVFERGEITYNHLLNKIYGEDYVSKRRIRENGKTIGISKAYKLKGIVPKYGYTFKEALPRRMRSKLYNMFK